MVRGRLGQPFWRHVPVPEGENGWKSNNDEDGLTQVETCDVTFVDDEAGGRRRHISSVRPQAELAAWQE